MNAPGRHPNTRSIRRTLIHAFSALIVAVVLLGVAAMAQVLVATGQMDAGMTQIDHRASLERNLHHFLDAQNSALQEARLSRDPGLIDQYEASAATSDETRIQLAVVVAGDGEITAQLGRIEQAVNAWRAAFARPAVAAIRSGLPIAPEDAQAGERLYTTISTEIGTLEKLVTARGQTELTQVRDATTLIVGTIAAVLAVLIIGLVVITGIVLRLVSSPLNRLIGQVRALQSGEAVSFEARRDDEIGELAETLEELRSTLHGRYEEARVEAARAELFNRLGERISFAAGETEIVVAAAAVLRRLVPGAAGDVVLLNASQDRLTVAGAWGEAPREIGSSIAIGSPAQCPGIRSSSIYVAVDASDELSVGCGVHSVAAGSVACVPMLALGQVIGVIHLGRSEAGSFDADTLRMAARVAEQIALAVANARLVRTMEGLAMTDPGTGVRNARFFDGLLERELAGRDLDGPPIGVIFIDLDHFKRFNDTYGHPAGDEALRAFARTVTSVVRESDTVARYGGEEFVVALPGADIDAAIVVAEKIRLAVEQLVVKIGPSRFARITASFGVSSSSVHGSDRMTLMRIADEALYQAKAGGRNRVVAAGELAVDASGATRRRAADEAGSDESLAGRPGPTVIDEVAAAAAERRGRRRSRSLPVSRSA